MDFLDRKAKVILACDLDRLIKEKAQRQGLPYDLDPGFFFVALNRGMKNFFGIQTDGQKIINDPASSCMNLAEFFSPEISKTLH